MKKKEITVISPTIHNIKNMKLKFFFLCQLIGICLLQACNKNEVKNQKEIEFASSLNLPELTVFEAPNGAPKNETFSVFVRYEGGEWVDLYEYDAEVDGGHMKTPIYHMSFVSFDSDFSKKIDVKIKKNVGDVSNVSIRPAISGVIPQIDGNTITFSLTSAQKLSVEINGSLHNNLMVFANKTEDSPINGNDPNVRYYGPGIHKIGDNGQGTLFLHDNDKVYIAGGAIVYGSISANGAKNISITGRGILCGGMYTDHAYPHPNGKGLIKISNSSNVKIAGITLLDTVMWNIHLENCDDVICDNLKIMGWTINSDGIDPTSSSDVTINDCFVRNYDDCISIKLSYGLGGASNPRGSHNITIQNCIFWTDQGRSILIGPESYSIQDKTFTNINVKNIDVLYNKNYDTDWAKGVLAINLGDDAIVKDVTFEDIRVDKIGDHTNLITISILQSPFNISPGQSIQNIKFDRITLNSSLNINNFIEGYDQSRIISGVYFTDLKINNSYIANAASGNFQINDFTKDVSFQISN